MNKPTYTSVLKTGSFAVRNYRQLVFAQVAIRGNLDEANEIGSEMLTEYMFGKNEFNEPLTILAPSFIEILDVDHFMIKFLMPEKFIDMSQLPKPHSNQITFENFLPGQFGVLAFHGNLKPESLARKQAELSERLTTRGLIPKGSFLIAQYSAGYVPGILRYNELLIRLGE